MSIRSELCVIIPNWNGKDKIAKCIDSLLIQKKKVDVVVVENGSTDGSLEFLQNKFKNINIIANSINLGFAGGVNAGLKKTIEDYRYVALLNNDAYVDVNWSEELLKTIVSNSNIGIVTSKILSTKGRLDSTGDFYTSWGLPYPRGRNEKDKNQYDNSIEIFGASGGSSIYNSEMLKDIGLFDEDFFAYYEDVDLSFRARISGWKITYEPKAITYHQIGASSKKIKGFTTYQTTKNLPWLLIKNVPTRYLLPTMLRFSFVYVSFIFSSISRGDFKYAIKGVFVSLILIPKKIVERFKIQSSKKIKSSELWSLVVKDLPPNAKKLRVLRNTLSLGIISK